MRRGHCQRFQSLPVRNRRRYLARDMTGKRDFMQQGGDITKASADKVGTICRAIRRAILERALAPADKLPEDALGERFGVSRTIARHALGQLASEGLVELRRNRMAVVATPSFEEALDDCDIRSVLVRLVV